MAYTLRKTVTIHVSISSLQNCFLDLINCQKISKTSEYFDDFWIIGKFIKHSFLTATSILQKIGFAKFLAYEYQDLIMVLDSSIFLIVHLCIYYSPDKIRYVRSKILNY